MAAKPREHNGPRFDALRLAVGFSTFKALAEAIEAVGGAISEGSLRNYAYTRGVPKDDDARGPLAKALGLTRDDFATYLDHGIELDEAVKRSTRTTPTTIAPPRSADVVPTGPLLRHHPEWADLCAHAMRADKSIDPADLKAIGLEPFLYGPLESVTVEHVVDIARIYRQLRGRS